MSVAAAEHENSVSRYQAQETVEDCGTGDDEWEAVLHQTEPCSADGVLDEDVYLCYWMDVSSDLLLV